MQNYEINEKKICLSGKSEEAMDIYQHSLNNAPPGISSSTVNEESEPEYLAACVIDGVFDNDRINGKTKWTDVDDMFDVYLDNADTDPGAVSLAREIVQDICTKTGNLKG